MDGCRGVVGGTLLAVATVRPWPRACSFYLSPHIYNSMRYHRYGTLEEANNQRNSVLSYTPTPAHSRYCLIRLASLPHSAPCECCFVHWEASTPDSDYTSVREPFVNHRGGYPGENPAGPCNGRVQPRTVDFLEHPCESAGRLWPGQQL